MSKSNNPVFLFLFIVKAESFQDVLFRLRFFNINWALDVINIKMNISIHNLETVGFFPSSRDGDGSELLDVDRFDEGIDVGVFEDWQGLFV